MFLDLTEWTEKSGKQIEDNNMDLEKIISSYQFDGNLKEVYDKYGCETIVNEVLRLLDKSSKHPEQNGNAFARELMFLSDLASNISNLKDEDCQCITAHLTASKFAGKIEKYLYHENLTVKLNTINILGKLSIKENAVYLEKAFEKAYKDTNPVAAFHCLQELNWLQSDKTNILIHDLMNHSSLINQMTLCLYDGSSRLYKEDFANLLFRYGKDYDSNIRQIPVKDFYLFLSGFEEMVLNLHSSLAISDWDKEGYAKMILFYSRNYPDIYKSNEPDYKSVYRKISKYRVAAGG